MILTVDAQILSRSPSSPPLSSRPYHILVQCPTTGPLRTAGYGGHPSPWLRLYYQLSLQTCSCTNRPKNSAETRSTLYVTSQAKLCKRGPGKHSSVKCSACCKTWAMAMARRTLRTLCKMSRERSPSTCRCVCVDPLYLL